MNLFEELKQYHKEQQWPDKYNNESTDHGLGISLDEGLLYYSLARHFKPHTLIESGTNTGNSTWFLGKALEKNGFGEIETIDNQEFPFLTKDFKNVHHHKRDIFEWMSDNKELLEKCDFFAHDDAHDKEHIMREMEVISEFAPKIITIHDTEECSPMTKRKAESWDFWKYVLENNDYLPDYERHTLHSVMGIGVLVRKDLEDLPY